MMLVALFIGLLLLRSWLGSDGDNEDSVPETGTIITDDMSYTLATANDSSGGTFDIQNGDNVTDVNSAKNAQVFYLKLNNNIITIYKNNGEFYDYAQVDIDNLPQDVLGDLKMGMEIVGEDSLYEFLQGYAS